MSIIYDALKKVQKSSHLDLKVDKTSKPKPKLKVYLLYILSVCLGFFVANKFLGLLTRKLLQSETNRVVAKVEPPATPKQDEEKPALESDLLEPIQPPKQDESINQLKSSLVLNGVFFSGDEGYALINNQILKEGDVIEGAKVKRITLDGVDLEFKGELIKLSK